MPAEVRAITALMTIFFVVWTAAALFGAIWPRRMWGLTQSWKAAREPSAAYFFFQRVIAGAFALIGLAFLLYPLFR